MSTYILGIDNGITGSITLMSPEGKVLFYEPIPIYKERKWTKPTKTIVRKKATKTKPAEKQIKIEYDNITMIDIAYLQRLIVKYTGTLNDVHCFLERPAISYAAAWSMKTSVSAAMSWAYVVYVLKNLHIPRTDIDSKEWQHQLIPEASGEQNKEYMKTLKPGERNKLLKEAAYDLAKTIYPALNSKDKGAGDSICIAEYGRLKMNGGLV